MRFNIKILLDLKTEETEKKSKKVKKIKQSNF